MVTVHRQAFSELKMPYDTVVVADFADLECEASAKSVTGTRYECTVTPCEKSFDRFRNLLIILSRLCYTFIHSMSLRFVIVFWRLNYTKTIGFMLFLCQLLLNFQGA